jgi:glycerol uptake facilitator-like aquaporin
MRPFDPKVQIGGFAMAGLIRAMAPPVQTASNPACDEGPLVMRRRQ